MSTNSERGAASRPALARLISEAPDVFARDTWANGPLLSRASELSGAFDDLFSLGAVDELVASRAIRTPFVRMANEGTLLDPSRYTSAGGFGAEVSDQLDSEKVLREFAGGATLVLQGLHRTWRPLADFTRQLVADLGHPAQVNAYVTPASSRGFDPHYDVHDVFVIQVAGQKHWKLHRPVHESPLRNQPWTDHKDAVAARALEEPAIDATFEPGDVLYLPRGWIHSATALGGTSVHLTIGVSALTRWDVVQQLIAAAGDAAELRGSLPLGVDYDDPTALEQLIEETATALESRFARPDAASISSKLGRIVRASIRPEPLSPIGTVGALSSLDGAENVRWRIGLHAAVSSDAQSVNIVLDDRTIALPLEAQAAIAELVTGAGVAAGSLSGLDRASSLVVVRRLVREGVLVLQP